MVGQTRQLRLQGPCFHLGESGLKRLLVLIHHHLSMWQVLSYLNFALRNNVQKRVLAIANLTMSSSFEGSGEILDDIVRHGNHDVIWCFLYERLVSTYVNINSNNKENEISFTNFHRRRLLTWILAQIHKDKDGLFPHQRLYQELHFALMAPTGYVIDSLV
ncbi:hypothetical protein GOP47_0007767 [Adiantum capillus-veneris]|uniref:Uncharacterized protein n=1 Tax=Adiantum capillus-veneris TaxID=13818 RepID=A0A9D4V283_ADICA|nr:hypothetical protein GOP47_0007767 [Adiantum capillus-veneris]